MKLKKAFTIIELSIALLIIALLAAAVGLSSGIIANMRLTNVQRITMNAPVPAIGEKDLVLWLETSLEENFVKNSAGQIRKWRNYGLNDIEAVQTVNDDKPLYVRDVIRNAIPVVRFSTSDVLNIDLTNLSHTEYSIFVVEGRNNSNSNSYMISTDNGSLASNRALHFGYLNNTTFKLDHYSNALSYSVPGYSSQNFQIHTAILSSSGRAIYSNGVLKASDSTATKLIIASEGRIGQGYDGATHQYRGDIAEIIIYKKALSSEARIAIEKYLSNKYSLELE